MSQEQPRRPQASQAAEHKEDPIKYGDVFNVFGDLAKKPIAPEDAAMMQSAENMMFGKTQKGGPASVMQSAATRNEQSETDIPGRRIVTESVAGQVLGQYVEATPIVQPTAQVANQNTITIGQALEATAQTEGNKAVDQSDAAAIQAAEVRATGSNVITPGGLAATAQSAAAYNAGVERADKAATRQDAEAVVGAELRNNLRLATHPGGVAVSVTAAARLNENVSL
ncbi:Late embryogenesis abundant protein D-34 [Quillaja saponaria]|uniref:Late embryogenesis abundant protein D-34 n=1 Tax=Quillaja saponaria TaxID=32244 RepID=A0AAD7LBA0_QUISA|nr:Late embryogenesis abundant protein D-34 [Quillaja saponaria]